MGKFMLLTSAMALSSAGIAIGIWLVCGNSNSGNIAFLVSACVAWIVSEVFVCMNV